MNIDASRGVSADMSIGAELDSVLWIGLGLLAAGGLFAAAAALAITAGARRRRAAPDDEGQGNRVEPGIDRRQRVREGRAARYKCGPRRSKC